MYFDDYSKTKKPNMNLGNKGITEKDDFLKKMREDEQKEKRKKQIIKSQQIIKNYFNSHSNLPLPNVRLLLTNLQSVIAHIDKASSLPQSQKDQIIIKSIDKTISESLMAFESKAILFKDKYALVKIISHLMIDMLSSSNLISLYVDSNRKLKEYIRLYTSLLQISIVEVYENVKKDYLLDDNYSLFRLLTVFMFVLPKDIIDVIVIKIKRNVSQIFLLKFIITKIDKILNQSSRENLISFIGSIANKIILKRIGTRDKCQMRDYNSEDETNISIIDDFLDGVLMTYAYIDYSKSQMNTNPIKELSLFNLCLHINSISFISKLKADNCLNLLKTFINDMNHSSNTKITDEHIILFTNLFRHLANFNLNNVNKTILLKSINDILDHLFKNITSTLPMNIINLIQSSSKLIQKLYESNLEKISYQSILDYIVNKICIKHYANISNDILIYSVKLLQETTNSKMSIGISSINNNNNTNNSSRIINSSRYYKDAFEVICFFIIDKINYKSNYFFVEFKATKDIYANLPFNYYYLNLLSKFLINLFTEEMSFINLEEIDRLKEDLILLCLKNLYLLDGDINFTYNREQFWNNLELTSKITGTNRELLIEKIKIMPFIFPLKTRLTLGTNEMMKWVQANQNSISNPNQFASDFYEENYYEDPYQYQHHNQQELREILIHRNRIFESSIGYYIQNQFPLYQQWHIVFVDQLNQREMGVDAGGLYKEFMGKLSEEAYSSSLGLFVESASGFLLPNKDSSKISDIHLIMFEFLGFITGKALREDIKLSCNLSPIFLNNILEIENSFVDLKSYDSELYKNLALLMQYQGDVETDFGLTFSLTQDLGDNKTKTINLIENGENILISNSNKLLYIKKITEYKLNFQFKDQCAAFRKGMEKTVDMELLKIYTADELRQLIYGFDKDAFDVTDLQMNAKYEGWNIKERKDMENLSNLWTILNEFDEKEKEKFLFFVTSLKRPPIGGFSKLIPTFTIMKSSIDIPTSSTCANMLKLPMLPLNKLREKLRYVINADAGFYYA